MGHKPQGFSTLCSKALEKRVNFGSGQQESGFASSHTPRHISPPASQKPHGKGRHSQRQTAAGAQHLLEDPNKASTFPALGRHHLNYRELNEPLTAPASPGAGHLGPRAWASPRGEGEAERAPAPTALRPRRRTAGGCWSFVGTTASGTWGFGAAPRDGGASAPPGDRRRGGEDARRAERGRRGHLGGRRRRSAAPAGRGGTSGPAGKLPD